MGKQDMPDHYARQQVDGFLNTTEDKVRDRWDKSVNDILTNIRMLLTQHYTEIFPLKCPKCDSYKITVVFGTTRQLECLSCKSRYRINDLDANGNPI